MKRRVVTCTLGLALIGGVTTFPPAPASAEQREFINPLVTAATNDPDIRSVRVDANSQTIEVRLRTENFGTNFIAEAQIGSDADFKGSALLNLRASGNEVQVTGRYRTLPPDGYRTIDPAHIRGKVEGSDVILQLDSSVVWWKSSNFVNAYAISGETFRYAGSAWVGDTIAGFGPIAFKPDETRVNATASKASQVYGGSDTVVIHAVAAPALPGTVAFWEGSNRLASYNTADGRASFQLPRTFAVGVHNVRTVFTPADELRHKDSDSTSVVTVNRIPTRVVMRLSSRSLIVGSSARVRADVTVTPGVAGRIDIFDGRTRVSSVPVRNAKASWLVPPSVSRPGAHGLRAVFVPSDSAHYSASETTAGLAVKVKPRVGLKLSKSRQVAGRNRAKATVSVSGGAGGKVVILDGRRKLKTLTLSRGKVQFRLAKNLKRGTHKIRAIFIPADSTRHAGAASSIRKLRIVRAG